MKTTYHNIPALPFAADADVEALRRQLEGGSLEANEDGTVSTKDSKVTLTGTTRPAVLSLVILKVTAIGTSLKPRDPAMVHIILPHGMK